MPYKTKKQRLDYMKRWRRKHPTYMSDYWKKYRLLGGARKRDLVKIEVEL